MLLAVADQVGATHGLERLAQQGPVVRIVVAQECLVQAPALVATHNVNPCTVTRHFAQRIATAVVHGRGTGHWGGIKSLHLVSPEAIFLQPQRQSHHVFIAGTRMRCNEIGNQKLLLAGLQRILVKKALELVVGPDAGFHHQRQGRLLGVFGRNLQVAAHVVRHQFLHVLRALHCQVIA